MRKCVGVIVGPKTVQINQQTYIEDSHIKMSFPRPTILP